MRLQHKKVLALAQVIADLRIEAKNKGNFVLADILRDQLIENGISVHDKADGSCEVGLTGDIQESYIVGEIPELLLSKASK